MRKLIIAVPLLFLFGCKDLPKLPSTVEHDEQITDLNARVTTLETLAHEPHGKKKILAPIAGGNQ